jgi:hypothetical protein
MGPGAVRVVRGVRRIGLHDRTAGPGPGRKHGRACATVLYLHMDVLKRQIMEPRASSPAGRVESNRRPSYGHGRGAPSSVGNGVLEHLPRGITVLYLLITPSFSGTQSSVSNQARSCSLRRRAARPVLSSSGAPGNGVIELSQLDREGRSHKSSSPAHLPILRTHNAVVDVLFG